MPESTSVCSGLYLRAARRWAGFAVTLALVLFCFFTFAACLHAPVLAGSPSAADVFFSALAAASFVMTMWSLAVLFASHPGAPPPWLAEEPVETFVRGVLSDVVRYGGTNNISNINNNNNNNNNINITEVERDLLEGRRSANKTLAAAQQLQVRSDGNGGGRGRDKSSIAVRFVHDADMQECDMEHEEKEKENKNITTKEEEEEGITTTTTTTRTNRGRRCLHGSLDQLWMPHRNICLVASDALAALDRTPESREQEMTFLLGGGRLCRFCHVYKLAETHHCSRCGTCVYAMDHHCPWIGQCIGYDNHKQFLLFIGYLIVLTGGMMAHVTFTAQGRMCSPLMDDSPMIFLFVYIITGSFLIVLIVFLLQDLVLLGKGENILRLIRREELAMDEMRRSGAYAFVVDGSRDDVDSGGCDNDQRGRGFALQNIRRAFGVGSICPFWFLPVRPLRPPVAVEEAKFLAKYKLVVLRQLRVIVDAEDEHNSNDNSDEDEMERRGGVAQRF